MNTPERYGKSHGLSFRRYFIIVFLTKICLLTLCGCGPRYYLYDNGRDAAAISQTHPGAQYVGALPDVNGRFIMIDSGSVYYIRTLDNSNNPVIEKHLLYRFNGDSRLTRK